MYNGIPVLLKDMVVSNLFDRPGIYNVTLEVTDQFGNKAIDWMTLTVRDTIPPVPIITGLTTILPTENLKLSGYRSTDNGNIIRYLWNIQDNGTTVTLEGQSIDYAMKLRGFHKVYLTVFDEWGKNATVNVTVESVDNNKPFASAGSDQTVAVGTTIDFDATGSHDDGTIVKYQWTFSYDDQKEELLGKTVSFKFDKPGVYEITLKLTDDSDNIGTDTLTVTVKNTGVVKGIVLDDKGKPIDGATIEIVASDGKTYSFTTAPDGSFSLSIPPGSFTWKISKSGYEVITGSSSVDILGENTLNLAGTPMKKTVSTGTSPILFIIPAVIVILLIVGVVIFLVMRKKKTGPETMEVKTEGEAIPTEPAEGGAPSETPLPPEASDFVQAPPDMEEDLPVEKVEQNTTVDDLLIDGSDHMVEERLNSEESS
jgi:plastocyanin